MIWGGPLNAFCCLSLGAERLGRRVGVIGRYCPKLFPRGRAHSHLHQERVGVPDAPHPRRHLVASVLPRALCWWRYRAMTGHYTFNSRFLMTDAFAHLLDRLWAISRSSFVKSSVHFSVLFIILICRTSLYILDTVVCCDFILQIFFSHSAGYHYFLP